MSLECPECERVFEGRQGLNLHRSKSKDHNPEFNDEEWLEEKYLEDLLRTREIAKEANCNHKVIEGNIREFGICFNIKGEIFCPECDMVFDDLRGLGRHRDSYHSKDRPNFKKEEWLRNEYYGKGKSIFEIAEEQEVSEPAVTRSMDRFDMDRRSKSRAQELKWEKRGKGIRDKYSKRMEEVGKSHSTTFWDTYSDEEIEKMKRKISESQKGPKNTKWVEREMTKCSICGDSVEHRSTIDRVLCGKTSCRRKWMERNNPMDNPKLRKKISKANKGLLKGRPPTYPDPFVVEETGHTVRSTWEESIDILLYNLDIEYSYEPMGFEYDEGRKYYPDFITGNTVIEVKGWADDRSIRKSKVFMEKYSDFKYIVVGGPDCKDTMEYDIFIPYEEYGKLEDHIQ